MWKALGIGSTSALCFSFLLSAYDEQNLAREKLKNETLGKTAELCSDQLVQCQAWQARMVVELGIITKQLKICTGDI